MRLTRYDYYAALGLIALLFLFFPDLAFVHSASLTGDHLAQHYPWAHLLANSVKEFRLPFWSSAIHCGFPIAAEGQIGVFYIPNLILSLLLPFNAAYSYTNLIHWFIAGWGMYFYAKQLRLSVLSSFFAAMIFVFGSAYGGAYYNITSLKTIAWFPLALFFLEKYFDTNHRRFLLGVAAIIGQSLVAGYLQVAILTWFIFTIYAILRTLLFSDEPLSSARIFKRFIELIFTAMSALLLAAPQIYLTFKLAMQSNRVELQEGYAYVGSLSPLVFATMIHPALSLILRGNNLYMGLLPAFFMLALFFSPEARKNQMVRLWGVMTLLALLLALGRWSPLYVAIIKLTKFYSFRVPAKFLVFISFGFAILSAFGFELIALGRVVQTSLKRAKCWFCWLIAMGMAVMGVFSYLLMGGRSFIETLGEFYVRHFVFSQPGHPHSLESYLAGVKAYPDSLLPYFDFHNPRNLLTFLSIVLACLFIGIFLKPQKMSRPILIAVFFLISLDLYALTYIDIRLDFDSYKKVTNPSEIISLLKHEKALGGFGRILSYRSPDKQLPFVPSQNMLYDIDEIGAYSPFVTARYFQTFGLLGNVNDSNYQTWPTPQFINEHMALLSYAGVSHIVSTEKLENQSLQLISASSTADVLLYKNRLPHERAHFTDKVEIYPDWATLKERLMAPNFDPAKVLLLESGESLHEMISYSSAVPEVSLIASVQHGVRSENSETWKLTTNRPGFFILSETAFPGWQARLNGIKVPILKAYGLFQAIRIDRAGDFTIQFIYKPFDISRDP